MNGKKSFSLTIVIIIFALLAIFVGYLLGNWLLQLVTGEQAPSEVSEDDFPVEQEEIVDSPTENGEESDADNDDVEELPEETELSQDEESLENQEDSGEENLFESEETSYSIQVGSFESYDNAESLQEELENEGYTSDIVSESPYRVHVMGAESREEAESVLEELLESGYQGFISH